MVEVGVGAAVFVVQPAIESDAIVRSATIAAVFLLIVRALFNARKLLCLNVKSGHKNSGWCLGMRVRITSGYKSCFGEKIRVDGKTLF
jgi:hypothetical protein